MFVQTYMTPDPVTVAPESDVVEALRTMERRGIRRLPVIEGGRLVGMVSRGELYRALPRDINPTKRDLPDNLRAGTPVSEIMSRDVVTAAPSEPLEEAAERMRRHGVGGMPVVQRGRVVGMITESDIFRAFMQVMGAGLGGIRVTFDMPPGPPAVQKVLQCANIYGIRVNSLAMCRSGAEDRMTFTLRIEGPDVERFIRALWQAGYRVMGVRRGQEAS